MPFRDKLQLGIFGLTEWIFKGSMLSQRQGSKFLRATSGLRTQKDLHVLIDIRLPDTHPQTTTRRGVFIRILLSACKARPAMRTGSPRPCTSVDPCLACSEFVQGKLVFRLSILWRRGYLYAWDLCLSVCLRNFGSFL